MFFIIILLLYCYGNIRLLHSFYNYPFTEMQEKSQQLIDSRESSKFEETISLELIHENSPILTTKLKVSTKFNPDKHYKMGLTYFTVCNKIVNNVNNNNTNNVFCNNYGSGWKTITILSGAYEIIQIDAEI